jgi:CRP/FNR family cyclic AMP-dependent transcriptional regulator
VVLLQPVTPLAFGRPTDERDVHTGEGTDPLLPVCFPLVNVGGEVACAAMATKTSYLDHLASVPLFSACSKKDLQRIAKASDEIDVQAGRVLVEQGKPGHEFFLIVDGTATVRRNDRKIASLGEGQYFGELSLLDRGPRSASVVADTDMTVLVLGQREFAAVIDDVPEMAHKLLGSMARRLREADTRAFSH